MPLDRLTKLDPLQLGRFTILARLGGGGMGNVYLAEADDGTPAAVKVIRAELAKDPQFRARFRREVEAGRRVQNRCIARYLDADTYAAAPWLATEFVPGPTLHHEVHAIGPVVGPRVLGLGAGLADALVAIHAAGLVHRDLKPANVLLAPDAPKVIDFGISLAADATILTTTGTLVGSPAYMSPEQARGIRDVGPAADVFSWASCMTFASRGDPPYGEGEAAGLLYKVVHELPDLTGVAPALVPFLSAALDKDPDNRPTALELVAGLTAVLDGRPPASLLAPPAAGTSRVLASTAGANAGRVLAATWVPDPAVVEEAELVMAEAYELRAGLPPRAEERSRRDRIRAKRAVFLAMLAAVVAFGVAVIATVRPGQEDDAKPTGLGLPADSQPTSTAPPSDGSAAPALPGAAPAPVAGYPDGGGGTTTSAAPAAAGAPATTSAPGAAPPPPPPPSNAPTLAAGPITTLRAMTCSVEVVGGPASDKLPSAGEYSLRVIGSSSYSTANLVLVRRDQQGRPPEAWVKQVGPGAAGQSLGVDRFSRQPLLAGGASETRYEGAIVHYEPVAPSPTFDLQLRANGYSMATCGTLSG